MFYWEPQLEMHKTLMDFRGIYLRKYGLPDKNKCLSVVLGTSRIPMVKFSDRSVKPLLFNFYRVFRHKLSVGLLKIEYFYAYKSFQN